MANYHLSIQIISRGKGKSAVAAAAYRSGETITNDYDGVTHDYTRKSGIVHTEILLPEHAPSEYANRAVLWNAVEKIEKSSNSQLAREIEFSLPVELSREQNISLARRFVKESFVNAGMCADVCVHDKDGTNPHAHVMLTLRPFYEDGSWGEKQRKEYILDNNGDKIYDPKKRQYKCKSVQTTDWNEQRKAEDWRAAWEDYCNDALRNNGFDITIDHRSYERQGIEQIPTVHLGPSASQMEKRGIRTERGDQNRRIAVTNKELRRLRARIDHLQKWIEEEAANTKPPALVDVIHEILSRQGQSGLTRLKNAAEVFSFLQRNEIYDMADLENKVKSMRGKVGRLREDLKPINRRIDTLKEHITHSENFKKYRKFKRQHDELYSQYETAKKATGFGAERKAQKALNAANDYYEFYRAELTLFNTADRYLRDVLQERFDPKKLPPITKWCDELATKTAEQDALYREYQALKDETAKVEKIRRSVAEIMQTEKPERIPQKSRGMEL